MWFDAFQREVSNGGFEQYLWIQRRAGGRAARSTRCVPWGAERVAVFIAVLAALSCCMARGWRKSAERCGTKY